jgi:PIN domain nuclease of toxin-antitoxin system
VLWELGATRRVSAVAQEAIEQATELLFSVVSFAEIGVKAASGKLSVPRDLRDHVLRSGVQTSAWTPITASRSRIFRCIIGTPSTGCSLRRLVRSS